MTLHVGRPRRREQCSGSAVSVRITTEERAAFEVAAKRSECSLSEWIRRAAHEAMRRENA